MSKLEYAIKCFVSRAAFHDEVAQYTDTSSPLHHFIPKVQDVVDNGDGKFLDVNRRPMPPCIVVEKGESLDMWMQRNKLAMDMFACMQVCELVAQQFPYVQPIQLLQSMHWLQSLHWLRVRA